MKLEAIGLETYIHQYSLPNLPGTSEIGSLHPRMKKRLPHSNVYAILRPRGAADRREAIVLVAEYNNIGNSGSFEQDMYPSSMAMVVALVRHLSNARWLSKNVIVVLADNGPRSVLDVAAVEAAAARAAGFGSGKRRGGGSDNGDDTATAAGTASQDGGVSSGAGSGSCVWEEGAAQWQQHGGEEADGGGSGGGSNGGSSGGSSSGGALPRVPLSQQQLEIAGTVDRHGKYSPRPVYCRGAPPATAAAAAAAATTAGDGAAGLGYRVAAGMGVAAWLQLYQDGAAAEGGAAAAADGGGAAPSGLRFAHRVSRADSVGDEVRRQQQQAWRRSSSNSSGGSATGTASASSSAPARHRRRRRNVTALNWFLGEERRTTAQSPLQRRQQRRQAVAQVDGRRQAGVLRAALVLEGEGGLPLRQMALTLSGSGGRLPNLDLVNAVRLHVTMTYVTGAVDALVGTAAATTGDDDVDDGSDGDDGSGGDDDTISAAVREMLGVAPLKTDAASTATTAATEGAGSSNDDDDNMMSHMEVEAPPPLRTPAAALPFSVTAHLWLLSAAQRLLPAAHLPAFRSALGRVASTFRFGAALALPPSCPHTHFLAYGIDAVCITPVQWSTVGATASPSSSSSASSSPSSPAAAAAPSVRLPVLQSLRHTLAKRQQRRQRRQPVQGQGERQRWRQQQLATAPQSTEEYFALTSAARAGWYLPRPATAGVVSNNSSNASQSSSNNIEAQSLDWFPHRRPVTASHLAYLRRRASDLSRLSPRQQLRLASAAGREFHRSGSSLEATARALSNLAEQLHQSFRLYLLPSPTQFVSIGEYCYSLLLLLAPLAASGLRLLVPLRAPRVALAITVCAIAVACGALCLGLVRFTQSLVPLIATYNAATVPAPNRPPSLSPAAAAGLWAALWLLQCITVWALAVALLPCLTWLQVFQPPVPYGADSAPRSAEEQERPTASGHSCGGAGTMAAATAVTASATAAYDDSAESVGTTEEEEEEERVGRRFTGAVNSDAAGAVGSGDDAGGGVLDLVENESELSSDGSGSGSDCCDSGWGVGGRGRHDMPRLFLGTGGDRGNSGDDNTTGGECKLAATDVRSGGSAANGALPPPPPPPPPPPLRPLVSPAEAGWRSVKAVWLAYVFLLHGVLGVPHYTLALSSAALSLPLALAVQPRSSPWARRLQLLVLLLCSPPVLCITCSLVGGSGGGSAIFSGLLLPVATLLSQYSTLATLHLPLLCMHVVPAHIVACFLHFQPAE